MFRCTHKRSWCLHKPCYLNPVQVHRLCTKRSWCFPELGFCEAKTQFKLQQLRFCKQANSKVVLYWCKNEVCLQPEPCSGACISEATACNLNPVQVQQRSWCKNEVGAKTKLVQKRSFCKQASKQARNRRCSRQAAAKASTSEAYASKNKVCAHTSEACVCKNEVGACLQKRSFCNTSEAYASKNKVAAKTKLLLP